MFTWSILETTETGELKSIEQGQPVKTTVFTGCSFNGLEWPVFLAASLGNGRVVPCAGCRGMLTLCNI